MDKQQQGDLQVILHLSERVIVNRRHLSVMVMHFPFLRPHSDYNSFDSHITSLESLLVLRACITYKLM